MAFVHNTIWGAPTLTSHLRPLHLLQKRLIRIIASKAPNSSTGGFLYSYGILSIPYLYVKRVCLLVRKHLLAGGNAINRNVAGIHNYKLSSHRYGTRSRDQALISTASQGPLATAYAEIWNSQPPGIRMEPCLSQFKLLLHSHLLMKQSEDRTIFTFRPPT